MNTRLVKRIRWVGLLEWILLLAITWVGVALIVTCAVQRL